MHEFSLKFLRCVRCAGKLELSEIFEQKSEIEEGFLKCTKCGLIFPILEKIPILWDDFSDYISSRRVLGGKLYTKTKNTTMKSFLKKSLTTKSNDDRTQLEQRWAKIYQNSSKSKFYVQVRKFLKKIPKSKLVLEHGCSIGLLTEHLSKKHDYVFGIDRSFSAISIAKKNNAKNLDYFVADSLYHPFGNQKFNLVIGLNLLEIIEPNQLLKMISRQITKGTVLLSDPYDFDRGKFSVKNPVDSILLRKKLEQLKFKISTNTKKSSYLSWNLNLNARTKLNYKVDVVMGMR